MSRFKSTLANPMLLGMVLPAEAYGPAIRRLEALAAVGATPHVRALDWNELAARYTAMVAPHPCSVCGATAAVPA